jgi:hydroxyacylglutathione hydrolase
MLEVLTLPVLTDNYIFVVHDDDSGETAVVDPALAEPVLGLLKERGWRLNAVYNTHHHWDHVGGNLELKSLTACEILASEYDKARIPGIDTALNEGDIIHLGKHPARILFVPGHTLGHIAYHFFEENLLFCGDTLFVMGCGRLFEGTAEQLWQSLQKLKILPPETEVYCTHEYTQSNGRFAMTVEPENVALLQRMIQVNQMRNENRPTVPTTIGEELETNPFFRENSPGLRKQLAMENDLPVSVFAKIRRLKDGF